VALQGFSDQEKRLLNHMLLRIQTNIIQHDKDLADVPSGIDEQR
jgi:hypothetical protein